MKLRVLIAGLMFGAAAFAADTGAELFQKAVTQERAAGNLEEAIKLYQRVATEFASDRALAAKALVAEARCYEKLGQDKAVKIYEQVARDYRDQREFVAAANARLTALRQPVAPTMTQRKIEAPVGVGDPGPVLTDGQRAIYIDYGANALMIADADGSHGRMIYKPKAGESFSQYCALAPSRDFQWVFFRLVAPGGQVLNAVIKTDGTEYRELFQGYPYGAVYPDWSWDHRYLLFSGVPAAAGEGRRNEATESGLTHVGGGVVLVSISDGKSREIARRGVTVPWAAFSPDGRFIAFSEAPAPNLAGKTFVAPVQGGEPRLISDDANLLDWTSDGRYMVASSRRAGAEALYLLPVKEGLSFGNPVFVRYGSFITGRSNPNGSLTYASIRSGGKAAFLAQLDSNGRVSEWKPIDLNIGGNGAFGTASWSPDSTQIAYGSSHDDSGQPGYAVRVRNIATGNEREVYRSANFLQCIWEIRRPNLFCIERSGAGIQALSVAMDSGHAETLGPLPPPTPASVLQLAREKSIELPQDLPNGFDGRVRIVNRDLEIRPTPDGEWKRLIRFNAPKSLTADVQYSSHGVFYQDKDAAGKKNLYRVSPDGGQPEQLGESPAALAGSGLDIIYVSPDGRRVLMVGVIGSASDVWLLENFEPKSSPAR
jgi:Tol biopolymer transport system component